MHHLCKDTAENLGKKFQQVNQQLNDLHGHDHHKDGNGSIDQQVQRERQPCETLTNHGKEHVPSPPVDQHTQETQQHKAAESEVNKQLDRKRKKIEDITPELEKIIQTGEKAYQFGNQEANHTFSSSYGDSIDCVAACS